MKRTSCFLVLGAFFFVLVAFTSIMLWQVSGVQSLLTKVIQNPSAHNWQAYFDSVEQPLALSAYVLAIIATGVLIVCFVLLSLRFHKSPISPKVLGALRDALKDGDFRVRYKAAVGLSELDMEESSHNFKHNQLEDALLEDMAQAFK